MTTLVLPVCPFSMFHQLASPPGFHGTHIPKGNLAKYKKMCIYQIISVRVMHAGTGAQQHKHTVIMREMAPGANGFFNISFLYFFAHPGAISPMGAISRIPVR